MYITSSKSTNLELAPLGLNLHTVEKMKDNALRNKGIFIRLTQHEQQQIQHRCQSLHLSQSDYIRLKIFTDAQPRFLDQREIHDVRVLGITLIKIFEQLKDTQIIHHEMMQINELIIEIKMTVRRLNDQLDRA